MILFLSHNQREFLIVKTMIRMYCRKKHSPVAGICSSCLELQDYAQKRLHHCVFGEQKPACKDCPVHCYSPSKREQMQQVMRWAGPRMIFAHPFYALIHLVDSGKKSKNPPKPTPK